jgi:hypothetical protein
MVGDSAVHLQEIQEIAATWTVDSRGDFSEDTEQDFDGHGVATQKSAARSRLPARPENDPAAPSLWLSPSGLQPVRLG